MCSLLTLGSTLHAQQMAIVDYGRQPGFLERIKYPFTVREVSPIRLANSSRLENLIRAGKLYLSLQDTIALALENNLDIELQRYGPEIARASLLRAEAGGLLRGIPSTIQQGASSAQAQATGGATGASSSTNSLTSTGSASTGGTVISATGTALQNLDPVFVSQGTFGHSTRPQANTVTTGLTALTFDSKQHAYAVQKSWLTGTTASFGWNNTTTRANNPLSDINPSTSSNFQLQVTQRLLQGFGRTVNNRNIRIARNNLRASDLVFQQQVIVTVSAIVNLYWDLVSYIEDVKVKQQSVALAQKLYEDNKKQVEIGTLAPIEIVSAEAEVARRQQELTTSETLVLQQETILKNALSRTGNLSPMVADARVVPTDRIPSTTDTIAPVNELYDLALKSRPDIAQTRVNIENAKIGLKGSRSQLLPSLDVVGTLQNNALIGQINTVPFPPNRPVTTVRQPDPFFIGGFGSGLEQLFRRNFPDYAVGFTLNIPLRNRSAQADMVLDQLSLRQAELNEQRALNSIRVDVQNAVIGLTQARARYETAVKERVLQEQTLDAEQKKYALGASTVFFVIRYQRDLAQAQSNEVTALSALQKARTQLELVTAQTLKNNNIDIAEAAAGKVSRGPSPLPPGQ
ncbi:MAG: TolC family protein [Bryobacterales bacterium]|nr:TolC family protein [Bryobacterales bacterium]